MDMNSGEILSELPVESYEELYSRLNQAAEINGEPVKTDLEGELEVQNDGLAHYQGAEEFTAVTGNVTGARSEDSEVYWFTVGEKTHWLNQERELK